MPPVKLCLRELARWQGRISRSMAWRKTAATCCSRFMLVSSLFLLWGVCNGMIDVMDKHFQEELGLSKRNRPGCSLRTIWDTS
jgi:hypothetical protein